MKKIVFTIIVIFITLLINIVLAINTESVSVYNSYYPKEYLNNKFKIACNK